MRKSGWLLVTAIVAVSLFALCGTASAAVSKVMCILWQGDATKPHTAISDEAVTLKGVVKTTSTDTIFYKWVFGDGMPVVTGTQSGAVQYNLAVDHNYVNGEVPWPSGTPFTAQLIVSDNEGFGNAVSSNYLIKIGDATLDSRINIAIDRGLWWLYNNSYNDGALYSYNSQPVTAWRQANYLSTLSCPTAAAVHAFGVNNHKYHGDPNVDPYVEAVRNGMNWLTNGYYYTSSYPTLSALSIGPIDRGSSVFDNPEAGQLSPNQLGVQAYGSEYGTDAPYQGGQIMDAIISSGVLPTDLTGRDFTKTDGQVAHNWTYKELLQDMADMYSWGQYDYGPCNNGICGSWWYGWDYGWPGDNSASQWAAIGMIPAQQSPWNIVVPQWVKDYNKNWLVYSFCNNGPSIGYFGYNGACGSYNDGALNTTPSGMIQMAFDGLTNADTKWDYAQRAMADGWYILLEASSDSWGGNRTYGWFAMAKAMRLALPAQIDTITKSNGVNFDWYRGGTNFGNDANYDKGLAQRIVEVQSRDGYWTGELTDPTLTTAWMIITLKPALFRASPIACFTAHPNPTYSGLPVTFDPNCSGHSETGKSIKNLVKFEWDWNGDGVWDTSTVGPQAVRHTFTCSAIPCNFPVALRVTDDAGITKVLKGDCTEVGDPPHVADTACIQITDPPHPPVARAGGPYIASTTLPGAVPDTVWLNGTSSFHPDAGTHATTCSSCPYDKITDWEWDIVPPVTFDNIDLTGKIVSSIYEVSGRHDVGLRVTDNATASYPPYDVDMTDSNFTTVDAYDRCIPTITAAAKKGRVLVKWSGASMKRYDVYRSNSGPNTGFSKIAAKYTCSSGFCSFTDSFVVRGIKYYYRVKQSTGCGSSVAGDTP